MRGLVAELAERGLSEGGRRAASGSSPKSRTAIGRPRPFWLPCALIPTVRFSAGFYAGRAFSLLTASIVLIVMLAQTTRLYMRLARSNAMLRREQNNNR